MMITTMTITMRDMKTNMSMTTLRPKKQSPMSRDAPPELWCQFTTLRPAITFLNSRQRMLNPSTWPLP